MVKALLMALEAHKVRPNEAGKCGSGGGSGGCGWAAMKEPGVSSGFPLQVTETAYHIKVIWRVGKGYIMSHHPWQQLGATVETSPI